MARLANKTAIVTGASQGFGAGISRVLSRNGATVVAIDLKAPVEKGAYTDIVIGDVTQRETWQSAVDIAVQKHGGIDIVVHNAGWSYNAKPTLEVTEEEYRKVLSVNLDSLYSSVGVVIPQFLKQDRGGSVITISSTAAVRPRSKVVWYNASKAAVGIATQSLAVEYAPQRIRFNNINPCAGNTALLTAFAGGSLDGPGMERLTNSMPINRLVEPEDVGNAVAYLASDESSVVTGINLPVDGGRCV